MAITFRGFALFLNKARCVINLSQSIACNRPTQSSNLLSHLNFLTEARLNDERDLSLTYCDIRKFADFCRFNLVMEFAKSPLQGLGGK